MNHQSMLPKVAIIGGGASGLAAARALSKQGIHPTVFEKQLSAGGVWNYDAASKLTEDESTSEQPRKKFPMYHGLRTNLPKEIMAFRELPWTRNDVERSYVTHREVLNYLRDYEHAFDLTRYIRFGFSVTQLTVIANSRSLIQPPTGDEIWPQIQLEWLQHHPQPQQSSSAQDKFDAVLICNGHYALPAVPRIPGLDEHFVGKVIHSIEYDDPADFTGETVLCVGGRASGSDLAREISQHAEHVYLSDTKCISTCTFQNITVVPTTERILPSGEVCFQGISKPFPKVDTIIFCSGYDYDFPFINKDSNLPLQFRRGERRVKPLSEQLWHAVYPNVAFLGLPHSILPFPLFEFQAQAVVHQWLRQWSNSSSSSSSSVAGMLELPLLSERLHQAERDANSGGSKPDGRIPNDTHYLGSAQWDYCRRLAMYAGAYDRDADHYISTNKAIWDHSELERKSILPGAPDTYRLTCYKRHSEQGFFEVVSTALI